MRRSIVVVLAALVSAGIHAQTFTRSNTIQDVVAGESHANGAARWNSVVFGQLSSACWVTGPERVIELGEQASPQPRANAYDCVATSAFVDNTSSEPIYCTAVLKLAQPDDTGRTEISGEKVVMPGAFASVATSYGERANAPGKAETDCKVHEAPLPPSPPCNFKVLKAPFPDAFQPPESKQRGEQGNVIIDFRVDPEAQQVRDIRVTQSSGYPALDLAALKVGRKMVAITACPDQRFRIKVKFGRPVEPKPAPPAN